MISVRMLIFMCAVVVVFSAVACDDDVKDGEGTLSVEIWGEEYIEEGIPAEEFDDGFAISFNVFLVAVSNVTTASEGNNPAIEASAQLIWDLTKTGPFEVASAAAPVGDYVDTAYAIAPADADAASGNGSDADVQLMIDNGYSVYVAGTATDGTVTKSFAWGFETATEYGPCHSGGHLKDDGEATVQLTIHGDHLFYDDAVSDEPALVFSDIALADSDDDGEVTPSELAAYDITTLPNYGVGSLPIKNMWDFISHMTGTLGHIDGEGHCETN